MRYVQGTQVRLEADFFDTLSGKSASPDEVLCTVEDGFGGIIQYSMTAGQVASDPDIQGRYYFVCDTSPAWGDWFYQFESTGDEQVVGRRSFKVTPRIQVSA